MATESTEKAALSVGEKIAKAVAENIGNLTWNFLENIGCEAFCELLDFGKDKFFEILKDVKVNARVSKGLKSIDKKLLDDLAKFVMSKKGKKTLPKKLRGKDITNIFMNTLDSVSMLADRYAKEKELSDEEAEALKFILAQVKAEVAQACLASLEKEDKRLLLALTQAMANVFDEKLEVCRLRVTEALEYRRPTKCSACGSNDLKYDNENLIANCRNCGEKTEYTIPHDSNETVISEFILSLGEATDSIREDISGLNDKLDAIMKNVNELLSSRQTEESISCQIGNNHIDNYQFVDAIYTFKRVLDKNPDSEAALWGYLRAYWGIVYLKGYNEEIEKPTFCYAQEPNSKLRFVDHEYYQRLLRVVKDPIRKAYYQEQQREIDTAIADIKRDINQKCDYDVFICVKIGLATEKDPFADRRKTTEDFGVAKEIYAKLTQKGLKVFCSQISRQAGIEYDKEIWSAMLRSKKILVIGSRKEYLESVWVQCEWRRWAYLIKKLDERDRKSFVALIPSSLCDSWEDVRPIEWQNLRVTVNTTVEQAIDAICHKDEVAGPIVYVDAAEKVRDIRALIVEGRTEEASRELDEQLRTHPGSGELLLLKIRLESNNFSQIDKIDPEAFKIACTRMEEAEHSLSKNPEYKKIKQIQKDEKKRLKQEKKANKKRLPKWPLFIIIPLLCVGLLFGATAITLTVGNNMLEQKRYEEAINWYKFPSIVPYSSADAQYGTAKSYYELGDHASAARYFEKAAESGHINAQNRIALCYYNGEGVPQSYEKAVEWYRLAAEQGDVYAQNSLGSCYQLGIGVKQNPENAAKWYKLAAAQGSAAAQYNLACCYYNGSGVTEDKDAAIKYLKLAIEQGYADAKTKLEEIQRCPHTGGTANCLYKAICELCGQEYGEIDPNKHTKFTKWTANADTHESKYLCCGQVDVASEAHEFVNGYCKECKYICKHTGGTATCSENKVCCFAV